MQPGVLYPVRFSVDYPDRSLNRLTSFFRAITIIPILFLSSLLTGTSWDWSNDAASDVTGSTQIVIAGIGLLVLPVAAMIVVRQKYPRWWFDWNVELSRFSSRIGVYAALMDDTYPSTDEHQSVHLEVDYPNVQQDLGRWMPLIKWFLAIPHYVVLFFLVIAAFVAVVIAWFAIVITGRYPRGLFTFIEGVMRWAHRVSGYAFMLVTDQYPPFSLEP